MKIDTSARKLKRNDVIVVGGEKYRVSMLNLRFGGSKKHERVSIHCHHTLDTSSTLNLNVPAKKTFTVTRKNK